MIIKLCNNCKTEFFTDPCPVCGSPLFTEIDRPPRDARQFVIGADQWPGLAKVGEEAGEVVQILAKLIATDGQTNYYDGTDLRERLIEELGDLQAAIQYCVDTNDFAEEVKARFEKKIQKFHVWHNQVQLEKRFR